MANGAASGVITSGVLSCRETDPDLTEESIQQSDITKAPLVVGGFAAGVAVVETAIGYGIGYALGYLLK